MITPNEMTIVATDDAARSTALGLQMRVISRLTRPTINRSQNLFILTSATSVETVARSILDAGRKVRAIFVRADVRPEWIPETLYRCKFRSLRSVVIHQNDDPVVRRVLRAWEMGAQNQLIADAEVVGEKVEVRSCALDRLEVPFDAIPALAKIPEEDRNDFEIDHDGTRISWARHKVDLGLDAIRYATDVEWRDRADRASRVRDARFGAAIAKVRNKRSIPQSGISGLSERQVRRIEKGVSSPRLETLRRLAAAHGLSRKAYLDEVAQVASSLPR